MPAVILVGTTAEEANRRCELETFAASNGAGLAFLQLAGPSLVEVLSGIDDQVLLVPVQLGERTARSWVARVAGAAVRADATSPISVSAGTLTRLEPELLERVSTASTREITGSEAPLVSPAWEEVPAFADHILVCRGPRCSARGSNGLLQRLTAELRRAGLEDDDVLVTQAGCLFPCNQAPVMVVYPDGEWIRAVDEATVDALVRRLVGG